MNTLYYGDNLNILRRYIKDESVDLVYLDPPFNSRAQLQRAVQRRERTRGRFARVALVDRQLIDNFARKEKL